MLRRSYEAAGSTEEEAWSTEAWIDRVAAGPTEAWIRAEVAGSGEHVEQALGVEGQEAGSEMEYVFAEHACTRL